MIRPDIKTYREDRRRHFIESDRHRSHFLGKSNFDLYNQNNTPFANIRRDGILFELEVVMPGFKKEEISVTVNDDVLTVRGRKADAPKAVPSDYIVREYDVDSVERKFLLAKGFGHDKINAAYKNGILKLQFEDRCEVQDTMKKRVMVD